MEHSETARGRPAMILVASDQEWTSRSLDSILGPQGYAVLRAQSGVHVIDLARTTSPDAVILDTRTRDMDGFELCRTLRDQVVGPRTPILLLSASAVGRAEKLRAFSAGAWEFLSHPIDGETLLLQLRTFLASKQEADRLKELNLIDDPTGLYSIRGLARRAREIGAEAVRRRIPLACVAVAPVMGASGPGSKDGDDSGVFDYLASVLLSTGRVSDAIGRFGQNEFGVVAPATDANGAQQLVLRLRSALHNDPFKRDGRPVPIDIGAGYQAVDNFADSPIDAVEMLIRASASLRATLSHAPEDDQREFIPPPSNLVS